ncbi:NTPase KAP family P-loop domain-containing protein 1-like [Discoglossus pictus]
MVCPDFDTKDDVYCFSLAKTLYNVIPPVTVGFYASWGRRKDILLNKIETYLYEESQKKEQEEIQRNGQRTRKTTGKDLLKLLFLLIFHHPVITEKHKARKNIKYVFIRFSAWEYAGSDQLWAGLVTTLCDGIENYFGLLPISVYRVVGRKTKIIDAPLKEEWISKKFLCIPLWIATILVILLGIGVGSLILIFGFPIGNTSGDMMVAVEGIGASVVGIGAAGVIRAAILVIKNSIITQKSEVQRKMNRTDMSSQLGFMSDVKREVKVITRYLQLMEVFQRQKIRVVLEITNLDKCMPDKVVGVLNAMNILLSDPNAPFISILAVDPSIIVDCVENSLILKGMANNGYQFLNRIITLPFSIPKMDCDTKLYILRHIIEGTGEVCQVMEEGDGSVDPVDAPRYKDRSQIRQRFLTSNEFIDNDIPLMVNCQEEFSQQNNFSLCKGPKTKVLLEEALSYLFDDTMKYYLTDNVVHMRRVVNTIIITIRLMIRMVPRDQISPRKVTEWVILATQWPCRLSWVLQCVEDEMQRRCMEKTDSDNETSSYCNFLLWDIFEKSLEELDTIKNNLKSLLELDGDPELFHELLCNKFTVSDANFFLPFTVNLDYSLKRQMELLRGSNNLWEAKRANRLTMLSLLNMSVEEICKEMSKLQFKEENLQMYREKIRGHNLNGRALVYSDNNEIKDVLGMGLGDWTLFSVYFLGVLPPPQAVPSSATTFVKQEALKLGVDSGEDLIRGSKLSLALSRDNLH